MAARKNPVSVDFDFGTALALNHRGGLPMTYLKAAAVPLVLIALVCALVPPADASGRGRPGSSARSSSSGGSASGSASRPSSSGGTVARGRATYGYGGGHHGHHGYYGYWGGYYGGYPYGGWYGPSFGWYGWPYYYGYPVYRRVGFTGDRQAPGVFETDVKPRKAEVSVDGVVVGQARDYNGSWDLLYVPPGEHTLEFRFDGYRTLRRHVEVRPGGYYFIGEKLARGEGIDPRSNERPPAAAPQRQASDDPEFDTRVETRSGARSSIARGLLRIRATPSDAAVYLDGEFLARADELAKLHGALPVARGPHTIEIVRPGYGPVTRRVEVGDEPLSVEVELERRRGSSAGG
ncbi:MAG: PEGA domain-containing protein [bacterium]|nr:PEGA domain-containing protein [bacterium]